MSTRARLAPFLDLLDARYLPLLCVVAPQSWTVYAWLVRDGTPLWVAALGGFGYETVYVGAVAWAERGAGWPSARLPAVTALLFSVAVAVAYYAPQVGALAILHAGFPIVAYAYTAMMHGAARPVTTVSEPVTLLSLPDLAARHGVSVRTIRRRIAAGLVDRSAP